MFEWLKSLYKFLKKEENSFIKQTKTRTPLKRTGTIPLLTCYRRAKPRMLARFKV